ncbi:MAG: hypothetical protein HYX90_05760 [Chloroflexi bacterium]|nr:hypothetical protein [Chloroflexota bacterium]
MAELVDVYCDSFQMNVGPYGVTLNFSLSNPLPAAPGVVLQNERVATVRMSLEHTKVMAFVLRRHMMKYEREAGTSVHVPQALLNSLQISPEDWQSAWG